MSETPKQNPSRQAHEGRRGVRVQAGLRAGVIIGKGGQEIGVIIGKGGQEIGRRLG